MKAVITVLRSVEYATTVEMDEEEFKAFNDALDGEFRDRQIAERKLNSMIDTDDWVGDELIEVVSVDRVRED